MPHLASTGMTINFKIHYIVISKKMSKPDFRSRNISPVLSKRLKKKTEVPDIVNPRISDC